MIIYKSRCQTESTDCVPIAYGVTNLGLQCLIDPHQAAQDLELCGHGERVRE